MIELEIDTTDFTQAFKKFDRLEPQLANKALEKGLELVEEEARSRHRYTRRSGTLARSVQSMASAGIGKVYLDRGMAAYGPSIHEGFGTWTADRFLYEAVDRKDDEVYRLIERAINEAITKAGLS